MEIDRLDVQALNEILKQGSVELMSSRGRGRGRGKPAAPPSIANAPLASALPIIPIVTQPPPTYPEIFLPEPKDATTELELRALDYSKRLDALMKASSYFLTSKKQHKRRPADQPALDLIGKSTIGIERYSDRYLTHLQVPGRETIHAISTDLLFFPEELHAIYNPEKVQVISKQHTLKLPSIDDTLRRLEELEAKEQSDIISKGAAGEMGEDEDEEQEAVYEEEEFDDETDYNSNYFDGGEDYGDNDQGDDDPVY